MGKLASIVRPKINRCKFGDMIDRYAEDDADRAAVIDPDVTAVAVWQFVTQEWEFVSQTVVKDHRAGHCACHRVAA